MDNLQYFELFCLKYEYFKRNSVQQANRNLYKALTKVDSGLENKLNDVTRFPYSDDYGDAFSEEPPFPEKSPTSEEPPSSGKSSSSQESSFPVRTESYESEFMEPESALQKTSSSPKFDSDSSEGPPAKKARGAESEFKDAEPGPSDVGIPLRKASSPDIDSDNSNVSIEKDQTQAPRLLGGSLKHYIRWNYRKAADLELATTEFEYQDKWSPERILTLLSIRRISSTRTINLPVDTIFVTIGYRKIAIRMREKGKGFWFEIKYMSTENGCLVWYGDTVRYVDDYKYQSLAAKDYFYVVKNKRMVFEELKFDIEEYIPRSVSVWPFKPFFRKLRNFFRESIDNGLFAKIRTGKFSMTVFKPHGEAEAGKPIRTNPVYPAIQRHCSHVVFHIWDDREICAQRGINYEKIKSLSQGLDAIFNQPLKLLEFGPLDYEFNSTDFSSLLHVSRVKKSLSQNEFKELLLSVSKASSNPFAPNHIFTLEVINSEFDFDEAKREIETMKEKLLLEKFKYKMPEPGGKKEIFLKWTGFLNSVPIPEDLRL